MLNPAVTSTIVANTILELATTAPSAPFAVPVAEAVAAEALAVPEDLAAAWKAAKLLVAPVVSFELMAKTMPPVEQWVA